MATTYELWLRKPDGTQVAVLDQYIGFECQRIVNQVGKAKVIIPWGIYDPTIFVDDAILEIWRSVDHKAPYLEGGSCYFLYDTYKRLSADGQKTLELDFLDPIQLIANRIIAYQSTSAQATKSTHADDMLKALFVENLGSSATETARSIASYITVQANMSAAPILGKSAARRNLLLVMQEIAASSWTAGTYLAFDVISKAPATGVQLEFQTYTGQRGIDHSYTSKTPVLLDPENGNLIELERALVRSKSENFIYAGGQGQGDLRYITSAYDSSTALETPFSRIEGWIDARNTSDPTSVLNEAYGELKNKRARKTFTARYIDTEGIKYGINFTYGDKVTCIWDNDFYDVRVETAGIKVQGQKETVDIVLRGDK